MASKNVLMAAVSAARLPEVLSAPGHRAGQQRMAATAAELSRRNVLIAKARLLQAALEKFINLCYESYADSNIPANADTTGRIIIATPWSSRSASHRAYGLNRGEADALRAEMHRRSLAGDPPPLFIYFEDERRWYLNVRQYSVLDGALEYAQQYPVTWRTVYVRVGA